MKKLITGLIALVILVSGQPAFATSSVTVPIAADVPQLLDLSVDVYAVPSTTNPLTMNPFEWPHVLPAAMNFGTLKFDSTWSVFRSDNFFTVILVARTSGRSYKITQTCAGIVNGANNLNKNVVMTPDYQAADSLVQSDPTDNPQGPIGTGSLGAAGLAVGANKLIYNSGSAGLTRIVRCYYGLATGKTTLAAGDPPGTPLDPPGVTPLASDAAAGSYSGSVTFSVVLN